MPIYLMEEELDESSSEKPLQPFVCEKADGEARPFSPVRRRLGSVSFVLSQLEKRLT